MTFSLMTLQLGWLSYDLLVDGAADDKTLKHANVLTVTYEVDRPALRYITMYLRAGRNASCDTIFLSWLLQGFVILPGPSSQQQLEILHSSSSAM